MLQHIASAATFLLLSACIPMSYPLGIPAFWRFPLPATWRERFSQGIEQRAPDGNDPATNDRVPQAPSADG